MSDPAIARPSLALSLNNYGHFLNHVIMLIYPTIALTLSDSWEIAKGEMLSAFFLGSLIYGFAAYPAGWLGDKWDRRAMLGIYLVGTGLVTFLTGFAENKTQIVIGLAFIGLFASIYHPVGTAFVVAHADNRARALGRNGAWGTAGLASAAFIAAGLTYLFGWRSAFFIPGFLCFALGVVFFIYTPSLVKPRQDGQDTAGPGRLMFSPVMKRVFILMLVAILSTGLMTQAFTTGLPTVFDATLQKLVDMFSLAKEPGRTFTAAFVSTVILFGAAGQIIGGNLSSRFSPKHVYVAMFSITLPLALLAGQLDGFAVVLLGAIMMIAITGCLPAENCIIANFCPPSHHGRMFSLKFVVALGGGSAALLANGYIFDSTEGFGWFFGLLALLSLVIVVFASFLPAVAVQGGEDVTPAPAAAE